MKAGLVVSASQSSGCNYRHSAIGIGSWTTSTVRPAAAKAENMAVRSEDGARTGRRRWSSPGSTDRADARAQSSCRRGRARRPGQGDESTGQASSRLLGSDRLTQAVPYHYAAAATGATVVFSAGSCPLDSDGQVICTGDIAGQTRQSLANLAVALDDAGCTQADVVKTTRSRLPTAVNPLPSRRRRRFPQVQQDD
jgi:enamine deaminase RidA (YjgF/YER057c/UK114 family)